MSDPTRYVASYDFSAFQENQPSTPLPAVQIDVQFADIQTSTTSLRDAIRDIRRSDGALVNGIVTEDSLAPGLVATLTAQTNVAAAAASAVAAAGSAAEAAASAENAASSANDISSTLETLSASGGVSDWGYFSEAPTVTLDWGTFH